MGLRVTGLNAAVRFNKKLANKSATRRMMEDIIKDTVAMMRRYAAVDSGEMMNSITYEKVGNDNFKIIVDVPHAIYQEYGTKYMEAGTPENPKPVTSTSGKPAFRPFMRPAIFIINSDFSEYVRRLFMSFRI